MASGRHSGAGRRSGEGSEAVCGTKRPSGAPGAGGSWGIGLLLVETYELEESELAAVIAKMCVALEARVDVDQAWELASGEVGSLM